MAALGDTIGTIIIEAIASGGLMPHPRVTFGTGIGNITSGWLDRHAPLIQRAVEAEQARIRHARSNPPPLKVGPLPPTDTESRRRRA